MDNINSSLSTNVFANFQPKMLENKSIENIKSTNNEEKLSSAHFKEGSLGFLACLSIYFGFPRIIRPITRPYILKELKKLNDLPDKR